MGEAVQAGNVVRETPPAQQSRVRVDADAQRTALRDGPAQALSEGLHVANSPLPCQVADTAAAIPRVIRATSASPVTYGGMV
jgi:hypothetical protein